MHENKKISSIVDTGLADIEPVPLPVFPEKGIEADTLRLDRIHPVISGNKWFKLKYYLLDAAAGKSKTLISFGGAYSNHIVALACAAKQCGFESVGIIRGEASGRPSPTLQAAAGYGMQLRFMSRAEYREKTQWLHELSIKFPSSHIIPEGGAGEAGIKGSEEILALADQSKYSHIFCAMGTGTMCLGLARAASAQQYVHGICVLKGFQEFQDAARLRIHHDYHFGGYAKKTPELIHFMNQLHRQTGIPTDFVYTGKLFYAVADLAGRDYFPAGSRLLLIHSGGLQGNRSLPKGMLDF